MPSLIVAPLSTIRNWAAEAEKWVPGLNAVTYHGGGLYSQLTHILKAWRE
jgi:SNF2 family DNA or RNA helicase